MVWTQKEVTPVTVLWLCTSPCAKCHTPHVSKAANVPQQSNACPCLVQYRGDLPDLPTQPLLTTWTNNSFSTVSNPVVMTTARPDTYWHTAELQKKRKNAFNLFRLLTFIHKLYLSVPCNFSRHNTHRQMSLVSSISTADFSMAAPTQVYGPPSPKII